MHIDIYFDLICPWCYVGKRRFERALAARPALRPEVEWLPFQLHPAQTARRTDWAAGHVRRSGAEGARSAMPMADLARREGLDFVADTGLPTPPTLDAHRLVRWLSAQGLPPGTVIDALFAARYRDGRDLGDPSVLAGVAAELGADRAEAACFLQSGESAAVIRASDAAARRIGVHAVPCFVFDGRFALSGAQEPKTFLALLDLADADVFAPVA